ncbi:MAG: M24 family metallopeptidase [Alicyclobacillus shizuokensis]|nr:M24 family metallopeptidase [Alicyclobacillus shizuokensis]
MAYSDRVERVRSMLEEQGWDGLIIQRAINLAWLFGGRFHVNVATEQGLAAVFISQERIESAVSNIEQARLTAEEGLSADSVHVYPWYDEAARQGIVRRWRDGRRVVTDTEVAEAMRRMRIQLDQEQVEVYRQLGRRTSWAVEEACRLARAEDTEADLAARVAALCASQGLDAVVLLAAGERRAGLYRHPLPTPERLGRYAIVSLCARGGGLVAATTRTVAFAGLPEELARRYEAVLRVEARMLAATGPGVPLADVVREAQAAYAAQGFADAWMEHHQGGLIGFQSREVRADLGQSLPVPRLAAVAWNPSVTGAKVEDTFLVSESGREWLTGTHHYPQTEVQGDQVTLTRPWILVKNA